jgi:Flp pilus assembly protein TadG
MRRSDPRRGNALIEFALSFTVMWLVLSGVFQYGYMMWVYNGMVSSVSAAARFASLSDYTRGAASMETSVKNMVVYGNPKGTGLTLVPGLTTSNVNVRLAPDSSGVPTVVTVSIENFTVNAVFQKFHFDGKPLTSMKWAGRYIVP